MTNQLALAAPWFAAGMLTLFWEWFTAAVLDWTIASLAGLVLIGIAARHLIQRLETETPPPVPSRGRP